MNGSSRQGSVSSQGSGGPGSMTIASVVSDIKDKFKSEDEEHVSPFQGLDKASVLQETKMFHDPNMVTKHPRKCCQSITKLLHILSQGEPFTSAETTDVFFGVTKLFQSKDANLRRMMYLFIKEVAEATAADEVIIVTQSLTKDMNSDVDLYRANAIRVLCRIIDTSMLMAIERYIKQAIVDRNPLVASSALISGMQLIKHSPDAIRRWVNEVQEAMNSQHEMVQYHGVSLLYLIKQHDKLAISKLVSQLQKQGLRSALAVCSLIRYTTKLLQDDLTGPNAHVFYQFIESMLRHKNEMVTYEAARCICSLPLDSRELSPAIVVLQLLLSSPKPTLRFAAVRTLSYVAMTQPMIVTKCNEDMEALISDSNRSIATLAITTLLKTGAESSVDRLMKQISSFMSEIADEFKIVVVEAIRALCLKYPQKHRVLLNFLANSLREEGGFDLKDTVTNVMLDILERVPDSKEVGLLHLCEFIEDCEFTKLSVKILHVLGQKGPLTSRPSQYIRFIYNRVLLENVPVRASAVSALAQFAVRVENLKTSVSTLLRRCTLDEDDEVRDRATWYLSIINSCQVVPKKWLTEEMPIPALALQRSYEQYMLRPSEGPIVLENLPIVDVSAELAAQGHDKQTRSRRSSSVEAKAIADAAEASSGKSSADAAKDLYKIPQFAEYGSLFSSSKPVALTEEETEYVVSCTKHIFPNHVVFEFSVLNTVNEQLLTDISVEMEASEEDVWIPLNSISIDKLAYGERKSCYRSFEHNQEYAYPPVNFSAELKFNVYEIDPSTGEPEDQGFPEEYPMDDFEISSADMVAKVTVQDFKGAWGQIGDEAEVRVQYGLQFHSMEEAVSAIIGFLGLQPCDKTGEVQKNTQSHILIASGVFLGGVKALAKSKISLKPNENGNILLQMAIRSEDATVSQILSESIR